LPKKMEKPGNRGKSGAAKGRSAQHEASTSQKSETSRVKGSSAGSLGKVTAKKGCLPTILLAIVMIIAIIALF